jgi:hypothetical protein
LTGVLAGESAAIEMMPTSEADMAVEMWCANVTYHNTQWPAISLKEFHVFFEDSAEEFPEQLVLSK